MLAAHRSGIDVNLHTRRHALAGTEGVCLIAQGEHLPQPQLNLRNNRHLLSRGAARTRPFQCEEVHIFCDHGDLSEDRSNLILPVVHIHGADEAVSGMCSRAGAFWARLHIALDFCCGWSEWTRARVAKRR